MYSYNQMKVIVFLFLSAQYRCCCMTRGADNILLLLLTVLYHTKYLLHDCHTCESISHVLLVRLYSRWNRVAYNRVVLLMILVV